MCAVIMYCNCCVYIKCSSLSCVVHISHVTLQLQAKLTCLSTSYRYTIRSCHISIAPTAMCTTTFLLCMENEHNHCSR